MVQVDEVREVEKGNPEVEVKVSSSAHSQEIPRIAQDESVASFPAVAEEVRRIQEYEVNIPTEEDFQEVIQGRNKSLCGCSSSQGEIFGGIS
ncbi:unnamed protein product [Linum trigynum]|uniref:Uncharacterized protein n=1 Tax=Linum trigynum TaxID=586398 RepID=A0AAV2G7X2_9ROSI